MKKMTAKEFKDALDRAEMDFDCWGWEGIINEIIRMCQRDEQECFERGHNSTADMYHERWETLYNILDERGYYNERLNTAG